MTWIGQRAPLLLAALAVLGTASSALWMWGFTVDDALIAVRYARHIAAGEGYRFNAGGAVTDGVTPLPWPAMLLPLCGGAGANDAMVVLIRAKCMGFAAWAVAATAWGAAVARAPAHVTHKAVAVIALMLAVPVAAHAVSGMETGVAMALATLAALHAERPRVAACLAGLAASLRPEMAPWAIALGAGFAWAREGTPTRASRIATCMALSGLPFAVCVLVRMVCFGKPAPLAIFAKPSDLAHGLTYAGAAALATLAPILALSPIALARAPRPARVIATAGAVHFAVIIAVGGDWMPYARLAAPIAPSLLYAFVLAAPHAHRVASSGRAIAALALGAYLAVVAAPAGRHVMSDRARLIEAARPHLASSRVVAALDIGWPTAATEATIVDLAGLTDPQIAVLPGGHTSKRVGPAFLLERAPDTLVFRASSGLSATSLEAWRDATYAYAVEAHLVAQDLIADRYEPTAFLPLGATGGGYVVLKKRAVTP